MGRTLALVLLLLARVAASGPVRTEAAGLRFTVPAAWVRVPTDAESRAAQYRVPRAPGDEADTDAAVFFLGDGKGGSADDALARWCRRFVVAGSRPCREVATVDKRTISGLDVTTLDVAGTYVADGTGPGRPGVSGYRMLGAVVEGAGGPWFIEVLGPAATVAKAKSDFDALVGSVDAHH